MYVRIDVDNRTCEYEIETVNAAEFIRKIKKVAEIKKLEMRMVTRGKGAHQTLYLGARRTVVSQHGKNKELTAGAVHGMLKQLGLTIKDFEE